MADLSVDFAGIKSPNPFWLASAPPTFTSSPIQELIAEGVSVRVVDQAAPSCSRETGG